MSDDVFNKLAAILEQRKQADPNNSYVASLYHGGIDKILKKLGEEATETIIAGKGGKRDEIIAETADLWFHSLVLLVYNDINPQVIFDELAGRFGLSGLVEKAHRSK